MISAATISLILDLVQDAPELINAIKDDVALIDGGTLTDSQLAEKLKAMNIAWSTARAKWAASTPVGV